MNWGAGGEFEFDLSNGTTKVISEEGDELERIYETDGTRMWTIQARGIVVDTADTELYTHDPSTAAATRITTHGDDPVSIAVSPEGTWIVTGGLTDGIVRVGNASGGEPHLLLGHKGWIHAVAVSPDGRWVASGGDDKTIRLWPIPDLSKPPLHTLSHDKLISKLQSLTNLRVVRDEGSPTGWKVEIGPFPGWAKVPEW